MKGNQCWRYTHFPLNHDYGRKSSQNGFIFPQFEFHHPVLEIDIWKFRSLLPAQLQEIFVDPILKEQKKHQPSGPRNTSKVALSENSQTSGWRHSNKVKVQGATGSNKDGEKKNCTRQILSNQKMHLRFRQYISQIKKTKRPMLGDSILIADLCESTKKDSDTELKEQRNSSSASFPEDQDIFNGPSLATLNIAISTVFWGLSYGIMHNALPSLSVWHHLFSLSLIHDFRCHIRRSSFSVWTKKHGQNALLT